MNKNHSLILGIIILFIVYYCSIYSQAKQKTTVDSRKRIALVIGNAAYSVGPLKNPVNDANDLAAVLKEKGFKVIMSTNASRKEMVKALRDFDGSLDRDSVGFFYFSGHGLQMKGVNYLVPIDSDIKYDDEIEINCIQVARILGMLESKGNLINIVILDACRYHPFFSFSYHVEKHGKGLAKMLLPEGSLMVFATLPGQIVPDSRDRNSVFAGHLIKAIRESKLEIRALFDLVRKRVMKETKSKQIPWSNSTLASDFYFSEKLDKADQKDY